MAKKRYLISELETRWIPSTEAIPQQGLSLLAATQKGVFDAHYNENSGEYYVNYSPVALKGVTHWRLKPRNPNGSYLANGVLNLDVPTQI